MIRHRAGGQPQDEIWQRFTALDAFCDGLLRAAQRESGCQRRIASETEVAVGAALGLGGFGGLVLIPQTHWPWPVYCCSADRKTVQGEDRRSARQMSLERLEREEESTVQGWARGPDLWGPARGQSSTKSSPQPDSGPEPEAMALDGFLSFVANLAVAARVQHAFETEARTT